MKFLMEMLCLLGMDSSVSAHAFHIVTHQFCKITAFISAVFTSVLAVLHQPV